MSPLGSLRGRLTLALLLVLVLAVAASTGFDRADGWTDHRHPPNATLLGALDREPFQDGLVLASFSVPALLLIWLVGGWSLRPVLRASAEAARAGPRYPGARISRTGLPNEIVPLVDAVNSALDRMSDAVAAERRFTENAAHELRTPLAVLKLRLQRAQQAQSAAGAAAIDWPAVNRDLAQMQRLVSQLLDLARKEHAGRTEAPPHPAVNLSRLVREAASMLVPLIEAQQRTLVVDVPDRLMVAGHADDLRDAMRNLLENALLHGGGTITLHAGQIGPDEARCAELVVGDEGPGIVPAMQGRVFERFGKGMNTGGSGLGLAIVREVARQHGGNVIILPGAGCRFRMTVAGVRTATRSDVHLSEAASNALPVDPGL